MHGCLRQAAWGSGEHSVVDLAELEPCLAPDECFSDWTLCGQVLPLAVMCTTRLPLGRGHRPAGLDLSLRLELVDGGTRSVQASLTSDKGPTEFSGNLQRSSRLMKSVIPRFSKNTPDEALVLKKKDTSALSSACRVGK